MFAGTGQEAGSWLRDYYFWKRDYAFTILVGRDYEFTEVQYRLPGTHALFSEPEDFICDGVTVVFLVDLFQDLFLQLVKALVYDFR